MANEFSSPTFVMLKSKVAPTAELITETTESWLESNVDPDTGYVLDRTLTMENAAAPADMVGGLQTAKVDVSAMEKCTLVDVEASANLLDPTAVTMNTKININTGATSDNNSYWTTGFIPVESGKTYYLYRRDLSTTQGYGILAAFDSNKGILPASGTTTSASSYTVPSGVAFIRFSKSYVASWTYYLAKDFMFINDNSATAFVEFTPEKHYYLATDEFLQDTTVMTDTIYENKYLDFSMVNRLDPSECEAETLINATTGETGENSSYFTTDFIPIRQEETLYFYRIDTGEARNATRYAAYDKNKTVIPSLGSSDAANSVTQSGEMAYIRASFNLYTDYWRTPEGTACVANANPAFVPGYGGEAVFQSKYVRRIIPVKSTDTEKQIIEKFVLAFNAGNCDVVFERADYTFGTELAKVNTDYGMEFNEIPIGNGCRYFFNGSILTATIDLSQHPAVGDDEFYCNFFGCQRRPSDYELHDGVLIATDTRYVVHDESSGSAGVTGTYKHLYQNMELIYNTVSRQEAIRKCLGGGTGVDGVVEIIGCKFVTDGTSNCASFHGNIDDTTTAKFDINIRNCWFSNSFRINQMGPNQTARLLYSGNSATAAPTTSEGVTSTEFCNEIRT